MVTVNGESGDRFVITIVPALHLFRARKDSNGSNPTSTSASPSEIIVLVGFEPLESLRALNKCNAGTIVITNLSPLSPFTVTTGGGTYPDLDVLQALIREKTAKLIALNATALAKEAGNILSVNMVLLGSLVQTGSLPLSAESVKKAIQTRTRKAFLESNLSAFDLGFSAANTLS